MVYLLKGTTATLVTHLPVQCTDQAPLFRCTWSS